MNDKLSVADEAWIATALLHREHPDRNDFTMKEIVRRAEQIAAPEPLRTGVRHHVSYHAVAQTKPNPRTALPAVRNRSRPAASLQARRSAPPESPGQGKFRGWTSSR